MYMYVCKTCMNFSSSFTLSAFSTVIIVERRRRGSLFKYGDLGYAHATRKVLFYLQQTNK